MLTIDTGVVDRFFRHVEPELNSGCWLWSGHLERGYGRLSVRRRMVLAHRLSWEIHRGAVPEGAGYHGCCVLHRCDTPTCVNPGHLFLGTHSDNMKDKIAKGRGADARGSKSGRAKLDEVAVAAIRRALEAGASIKGQARRYGVSQRAIQFIARGVTWQHVRASA